MRFEYTSTCEVIKDTISGGHIPNTPTSHHFPLSPEGNDWRLVTMLILPDGHAWCFWEREKSEGVNLDRLKAVENDIFSGDKQLTPEYITKTLHLEVAGGTPGSVSDNSEGIVPPDGENWRLVSVNNYENLFWLTWGRLSPKDHG